MRRAKFRFTDSLTRHSATDEWELCPNVACGTSHPASMSVCCDVRRPSSSIH